MPRIVVIGGWLCSSSRRSRCRSPSLPARQDAAPSPPWTRFRCSFGTARSSASSASRAAARQRSRAASPASNSPSAGRVVVDGYRAPRAAERGTARGDPDRLPGPVLVAQPAADDTERPLRAPCGAPDRPAREAVEGRCRELMQLVGLPATALDGYRSPVLGRTAPAARDRARARGRAAPPRRRRGRLGARRVRAGRDPRALQVDRGGGGDRDPVRSRTTSPPSATCATGWR